jgi:hypothetical protein
MKKKMVLIHPEFNASYRAEIKKLGRKMKALGLPIRDPFREETSVPDWLEDAMEQILEKDSVDLKKFNLEFVLEVHAFPLPTFQRVLQVLKEEYGKKDACMIASCGAEFTRLSCFRKKGKSEVK